MEREDGVEGKPQGFRRVGAIKSRKNRDFLLGEFEASSVTVGKKKNSSADLRARSVREKEAGSSCQRIKGRGGARLPSRRELGRGEEMGRGDG